MPPRTVRYVAPPIGDPADSTSLTPRLSLGAVSEVESAALSNGRRVAAEEPRSENAILKRFLVVPQARDRRYYTQIDRPRTGGLSGTGAD